MKTLLKEYYRPTEDDFKSLWNDCEFAFDTSCLLNLYSYSEKATNTFLAVMQALKERVWIPYQVAWEFHRNRITTISKAAKEYDSALKPIEELRARLSARTQHPFLDEQSLKQLGDVQQNIEKSKARIRQLRDEDAICDHLTELFDEKVGQPLTQDALDAIFKDGKGRYEAKIPPGYMDLNEKQGDDVYGDLVVWLGLIERAKSEKKPLVLVTDDNKEDWWWIHNKRTVGPRPELLREFRDAAKQVYYQYTSDSFLKFAKAFLAASIDGDSIREIRTARERDRLQTFERGYESFQVEKSERLTTLERQLETLDPEGDEYYRVFQEYDRVASAEAARHFDSEFLPSLSPRVRNARTTLVQEIQGLLRECRSCAKWDDRSEYKLPAWLEQVPEEMIPFTSLPNLLAIRANLRELLARHC